MRNLTHLLFLILIATTLPAVAQTPAPPRIVESVEVVGIPTQRLSAELRTAINGLAGQPYDGTAVPAILNRIQDEIQGTIAAQRSLNGADAAHMRLVLVVATTAGAGDSNVNSQYTVEAVEVKGLERSQYSTAIYDEMQKMVGQKLDNNLAEELRVRLSSEVRKEYFIKQKIERGSMPEHIKVVYEAERTPWFFRVTIGRVFEGNIGKGKFEIGTPNRDKDTVEAVEVTGDSKGLVSNSLRSEMQAMVGKQIDNLEVDHLLDKLKAELKGDYSINKQLEDGTKAFQTRVVYKVERVPWLPYRVPRERAAYHQKQGITVVCCGDEFLNKYTTLNLIFDGDSLTERYKGLNFGLESRNLGTRHLGARLEGALYGVQWKDQTDRAIAGAPGLPGLYRKRRAIAPSLAFAFDRHLYVTAGADFAALEMQEPTRHWQNAHAGVGSVHFDSKKLKHGDTSYEVVANYEVRTGARNIGSDFSYTRHRFDLDYTMKHGKHTIELRSMLGKLKGNAPLFERFSLGNTETLRGWNKYDIDPLGADRVSHSSIEYRFTAIGAFYDEGEMSGYGLAKKTRRSVGLTLGRYVGIAMPLDCAGHCGITFFANFQ